MIKVRYEEYTNDYCRKYKDAGFYTMAEFVDWFFGLCDGSYKEKISIPNPDHWVYSDGPGSFDVNCMWTQNKHYWVHQIEDNGRIIMSDGKYTDGIKHWNDEVKQLCRDMLMRKDKPTFNFG